MGSEHPEQVVVVSGHLDSWDLGTGALDDGAGVAVSMQAIHLLKRTGKPSSAHSMPWLDPRGRRFGGSGNLHRRARGRCGQSYRRLRMRPGRCPTDSPVLLGQVGPGPVAGQLRCWRPSARRRSLASAETGEDTAVLTARGVPSFAPIQDSRTYFIYHHTAADTSTRRCQKSQKSSHLSCAVPLL